MGKLKQVIENEIEIKSLEDFKDIIISEDTSFFSRSDLIDILMDIDEDFSYILRACLICSNERIIEKDYLLEKVNYMLSHPNKPYAFMDLWRCNIYEELKSCLGKKDKKPKTLMEMLK